jgi:hypothetical protein
MLARLTAREYEEWKQYDYLEPIGELRGDFRAAQMCQIMAVGKVKVPEHNFMPFLHPDQPGSRKQSQSEIENRLRAAVAKNNAAKRKRGVS